MRGYMSIFIAAHSMQMFKDLLRVVVVILRRSNEINRNFLALFFDGLKVCVQCA